MNQTRIANRVKKTLQAGQITRGQAIKTLRDQTQFGTQIIISMVKKWEKQS